MKYLLNMALIAAALGAAAPAGAQPPAISYSFSSASTTGSGSSVPLPSRAPGADALRWLGGLGPTQTEPNAAPISDGLVARRAVLAHH